MERDQTDKKLTNNLPPANGVSWHSKPTSPTLLVPACPLATFSCFKLHYPHTQQKSAIVTSSKVSQMGGTISHVAIIKL